MNESARDGRTYFERLSFVAAQAHGIDLAVLSEELLDLALGVRLFRAEPFLYSAIMSASIRPSKVRSNMGTHGVDATLHLSLRFLNLRPAADVLPLCIDLELCTRTKGVDEPGHPLGLILAHALEGRDGRDRDPVLSVCGV